MEKILEMLAENPWLLLLIVTLIIGLLIFIAVIIYKAYLDGRKISIFGIKIGERYTADKTRQLIKDEADRIPQGRSEHKLYLHRSDIHWKSYNEKVSSRFWACGTSLIGVSEKRLVTRFFDKGIKDVRLLLPSIEQCHLSFHQLDQYDKLENKELVYNQVEAAKKSYKRLCDCLKKSPGIKEKDFIRTYTGIMYANITVYDDDAIISFYDSTGSGDNNISLQFDRTRNERGYQRVVDEFSRMWNAEPLIAELGNKKKGASMIFINSDNQVLLFLRDDKKEIPYPNYWDVLGGNVERDETPQDCIIREMKEELEIELKMPTLFNVYDMDDRIEYTFWMETNFDISKINLHEGQKLKWFAQQEILNTELAFNFKEILLDFFGAWPSLRT
jgi:8-oxo-dGTP diphosphatase